MKQYKIGKRSNTGTLCVALPQEMILDGYAAGLKVEWIKENGVWTCKKVEAAVATEAPKV